MRQGDPLWLRAGTVDWHILRRVIIEDEYRLSVFDGCRLRCAVDIGAHIGTVTRVLFPRTDRLLAFEPVSDNFALLQKNIGSQPSCQLVQAAVAERSGLVRIERSLSNTGGHSAYKSGRRYDGGFELSKAVHLPTFLIEAKVPSVDLMKIDAEGAEYGIIASLEQHGWLDRTITIVLEYHPVSADRPSPRDGQELEVLLLRYGFEVARLPNPSSVGYGLIFATRDPTIAARLCHFALG
jgi:FkbM family methyltransferase